MAKITWRPGTMLSPLPPALITSGDMEHPNVMTAAWTGIICSDPVITYVSIRPSRYTHELVSKNKEFVINVPTWKEASAVDTVGVKSGRDLDKFALTGLTPVTSTQVKAPQIEQCPISIECKVMEVRSFGTHDMFLAEVVAVNVDDKYINEDNALDLEKAGLLAYAHGFYYTLGRKIGKFGFSVENKENTKEEPKKENKPEIKEVNPEVTSERITLKAKDKFGRENTLEKFRKSLEDERTSNGVKVIVKKSRNPKAVEEDEKKEFTKKTFNKKRFDNKRDFNDKRDFDDKKNDKKRFDHKKDFGKKRDFNEKRDFDDKPYDDRKRFEGKKDFGERKSFGDKKDGFRGQGKSFGSKFSRKENKHTSYETQNFRKKSDGSFKHKDFKRK